MCLQLSQIVVESVYPSWNRTDDLRKTRVKDETRGQVIIFKKIQLGVIRIALNALDAHDAPILLIRYCLALPTWLLVIQSQSNLFSNNSEVQVSIKKRLSDCGFIASKVKFVIDDLLWVLNDSQIKAVISYVNMLKPLIMKAHKANQQLNSGENSESDLLKANSGSANHSSSNATSFRLPKNDTEVRMCKVFDLNDILETSYHLVCRRIDLHLVEDNSKRASEFSLSLFLSRLHIDPFVWLGYPSFVFVSAAANAPLRLEGGALQLSLRHLCVDHYPYHLVG